MGSLHSNPRDGPCLLLGVSVHVSTMCFYFQQLRVMLFKLKPGQA